MFCSCEMSSNCIWLQIIFRSVGKRNHAFLLLHPRPQSNPRATWLTRPRDEETTGSGDENAPSFDRQRQTWWSNEKQLLSSVIVKYRDLSLSCRSISCLPQPSAGSEVVLFDPRLNELEFRPFPRCPNKTASFAFVALCYYCFASLKLSSLSV